jgi:hypothetical protein
MDRLPQAGSPHFSLRRAGGSRQAASSALRRLVACLAVTLAVGCENSLQLVCTEIGCSSGVEVTLTRLPTAAFTIELAPLSASTVYSYRCAIPSDCATGVFFPEFTPDYVNVRVIVGPDTTTAEAVQPLYSEFRPNGTRCPPTCRVGHVTITPPGAERAGRPNKRMQLTGRAPLAVRLAGCGAGPTLVATTLFGSAPGRAGLARPAIDARIR